jgi:hypothetical protein
MLLRNSVHYLFIVSVLGAILLTDAGGLKVKATNWSELKKFCEAGHDVFLSHSFDTAHYPGEIKFSGKTCVVRGKGTTLDAGGKGRIFYGFGPGSSLELHGIILKNAKHHIGGAIYAGEGAYVEIFNSAFVSNSAPTPDGHDGQERCGVPGSCSASSPACRQIHQFSTDNCTHGLKCNTCGLGGALYANRAHVHMHNTTFEDNSANKGKDLYQVGSSVSFKGCIVEAGKLVEKEAVMTLSHQLPHPIPGSCAAALTSSPKNVVSYIEIKVVAGIVACMLLIGLAKHSRKQQASTKSAMKPANPGHGVNVEAPITPTNSPSPMSPI